MLYMSTTGQFSETHPTPLIHRIHQRKETGTMFQRALGFLAVFCVTVVGILNVLSLSLIVLHLCVWKVPWWFYLMGFLTPVSELLMVGVMVFGVTDGQVNGRMMRNLIFFGNVLCVLFCIGEAVMWLVDPEKTLVHDRVHDNAVMSLVVCCLGSAVFGVVLIVHFVRKFNWTIRVRGARDVSWKK